MLRDDFHTNFLYTEFEEGLSYGSVYMQHPRSFENNLTNRKTYLNKWTSRGCFTIMEFFSEITKIFNEENTTSIQQRVKFIKKNSITT